MDETPRSSKRRKLNTPARSVSTPVATSSARKASGKLTAPSSSAINGKAGEDSANGTTPKRSSSRLPKSAARGKSARSIPDIEVDLYDDIEGALGTTSPAASKKRQSKPVGKKDKASVAEASEQPQQATATPKQAKARTPRPRGNAKTSNTEEAVEEQEAIEVSEEATSSTKRGRARPSKPPAKAKNDEIHDTIAIQKRKKATPRGAKTSHDAEPTEEPLEVITPKKRSARSVKAQANGHTNSIELDHETNTQRTVIPDSEEELSKVPNARRRANRTDHINNHEEDIEGLENGANDEDAMDIDGNSVAGSVLDPTEPSPFNKPTPSRKEEPAIQVVFGNLPHGRELDLLKTVALERITGKRPSPLIGLDDEYKSVYQLVEHTITAGEGNSMLVIGARGSGKTALVDKVLSEVAKDNRQDYHVIRLNGFTHTDDKIALREIWRQLGKEMDVEEDGSGPGKNYADTLTTLLALLSHPSDHTGEVTDQVAKAVIFIMDEFELFAQHPRQTLLYNLFDIAQSRKAPIAVLGLTTRIDVANTLEKRVKSRFSHRYVHLSLAKTFTAFQEICKACLIIQPDQLSVEERVILEGATTGTPAKRKGGKKSVGQNVLTEWNANVNTFFSSKSFLTLHLAPYFYRTKSVPAVLQSFLLPTATLGPDTAFAATNILSRPDSKLSLIPHLSTLALSLLIATARLDIIHDSDTCNFNMAYDEYVTLASKARIQSAAGGVSASGSVSKVWGKDVARREWESLAELGLIMPVMTGQIGGFSMVRADVCLEEIGAVLAAEKGIDKGLERWCKQL